jgi:hypothetical protein
MYFISKNKQWVKVGLRVIIQWKKDTYSTHTGTMFKENPIDIIIFLLLMSLVIPKPFYLP